MRRAVMPEAMTYGTLIQTLDPTVKQTPMPSLR